MNMRSHFKDDVPHEHVTTISRRCEYLQLNIQLLINR